MSSPAIAIARTAVTAVLLSSALTSPVSAETTFPIRHAGVLEFSPDGTMFVGDSVSGAIYAFDLASSQQDTNGIQQDLDDIDVRIASLLGVSPRDIAINDLAVNPVSKEAFVSITRGHGDWAMPAIVAIGGSGEMRVVELDQTSFERQAILDMPDRDATFRPQSMIGAPTAKELAKSQNSMATLAIMDIDFHNNELFVAGVSNEEFSSTLRRIPFPFSGDYQSNNVEIFHVSHGQYETRAPIRSQVIKEVGGVDYLFASYTCSPLVVIPLDEIEDGAQIRARTVAELGWGQPVDMFTTSFFGMDHLVVTNNSRVTRRISLEALVNAEPLTENEFPLGYFNSGAQEGEIGDPLPIVGSPVHIANLNDETYVALVRDSTTGSLNLEYLFAASGVSKFHNITTEFDFYSYDMANYPRFE